MGITDKNLLRLPAMTKDNDDIEPLKAAKRCQILKTTIDVSEILTLEIPKDAMLWMR